MPRKEDMTSVSVVMSFENREKLNTFASQQGFKVTSDYIRGLIEADMRAKGTDIDLSVDRGGYRIRGEGESSDGA